MPVVSKVRQSRFFCESTVQQVSTGQPSTSFLSSLRAHAQCARHASQGRATHAAQRTPQPYQRPYCCRCAGELPTRSGGSPPQNMQSNPATRALLRLRLAMAFLGASSSRATKARLPRLAAGAAREAQMQGSSAAVLLPPLVGSRGAPGPLRRLLAAEHVDQIRQCMRRLQLGDGILRSLVVARKARSPGLATGAARDAQMQKLAVPHLRPYCCCRRWGAIGGPPAHSGGSSPRNWIGSGGAPSGRRRAPGAGGRASRYHSPGRLGMRCSARPLPQTRAQFHPSQPFCSSERIPLGFQG